MVSEKEYDDFVELYNDYTITVDKIKRQLGQRVYVRARKMALEKGDIHQRPNNLKDTSHFKYYHFDNQRQLYRVHKVKNGKYLDGGYYKTENEAIKVVNFLKSVDWDLSKLNGFLIR